MINPQQILEALNPEVIARFKTAIETGRWPTGELLTTEQRETCMEAVLVWEHYHTPPQERTGYIDRGSKQEGEHCATPDHSLNDQDEVKTVTLKPRS